MFKTINEKWESLCNGCGMCCYEKEFCEGVTYINMEKPCKYLDECSNSCKVYHKRFKVNRYCKKVNLFQALFNTYLPNSCGYVKKVRFWLRRSNG